MILTTGPRGGFKYLSYEYIDENGRNNSVSNSFQETSQEIIKFFEENKIPIERQVIKYK